MKRRLLLTLFALIFLFLPFLQGCNVPEEGGGEEKDLETVIAEYLEAFEEKYGEYQGVSRVEEAYLYGRLAIMMSETIEEAQTNYELALAYLEEAYQSGCELVINYVDEFGNTIYSPYRQLYARGSSYSVDSPEIFGYEPDKTTVSGSLDGDLTVTVTYSFGGTPDTLYAADGSPIPNGSTIEAYPGDPTIPWDHTGSTNKTYILSPDYIEGDFIVTIFLNTKFERPNPTYSSTARLYISDADNLANFWLYGFIGDHRTAEGTKLGAKNSQPFLGEGKGEEALQRIALMRNSDVLLTIKRTGSVIEWHATIIAGEGTGYEGLTFQNNATLTNVGPSRIQLALTNRAGASYTVKSIAYKILD